MFNNGRMPFMELDSNIIIDITNDINNNISDIWNSNENLKIIN